jgi:aspartate/methionine/tyrosine aminotransferase
MSRRLAGVPGFSIDRVAAQAGHDPDVLRLENLDTDLRPPEAALEATRRAIDDDSANSYLPFAGSDALRLAVARQLSLQTGVEYGPHQIVITSGGTEAIFDALLALTDPGDEVILTDPTYAGMIQRVRLAGAIPVFVPFIATASGWVLDCDALRAAINSRTKALFLMSPAMPSGAVLNGSDWATVAELCVRHDLWLLYNAAMERILFGGRAAVHPASIEGMAQRTVVVGSVSKHYRMIGWRVGWIGGPHPWIEQAAKARIYNVVTPGGLGQAGALAAISGQDDVPAAVREWERRHETLIRELDGLPVVPAQGGWSVLMNTVALGMAPDELSVRLLERARVAATPMTHWGPRVAPQHIRFVFSNEPVARLTGLGDRIRKAL